MRRLKWLTTVHGQLAIAGFLAVAWLTYMSIYGRSGPADVRPEVVPSSAPLGPENDTLYWIGGAVIVVWFGLCLWSVIKLARSDATRFRSLSPEEQARRREAGELLKRPDLIDPATGSST